MNQPITHDDMLDYLFVLRMEVLDKQIEMRKTIDALREPGPDGRPAVTWGEIAEVLGVTRQAVEQKYGTIKRGTDRAEAAGQGVLPQMPEANPQRSGGAAGSGRSKR